MKVSFVMPIRDRQDELVERVMLVLEAMDALAATDFEVIVVDDGSRDATAVRVERICAKEPRLRSVRYDRPRGFEAAGQTGLERATGEVVFIQENDRRLDRQDLNRLFELAGDPSVVAARIETGAASPGGPLVRRLKCWGMAADAQPLSTGNKKPASALQLIRRPHLQRLAGPMGSRMRLTSTTQHYLGRQTS